MQLGCFAVASVFDCITTVHACVFAGDLTPFKLSVYLDYLYVSSYHSHSVYRMHKFGLNPENLDHQKTLLVHSLIQVNDLLVIQENNQKGEWFM